MPSLTSLRSLLHLSTLLLLLHPPSVSSAIPFSDSDPNSNTDGPTRGINCLGSSQCSFTTVDSANILLEFNRTASSSPPPPSFSPLNFLPGPPLPPRALYRKGEHILCAENALVGSVCVFLQGAAVPATGVPGFVIRRRLQDLLDHGCKFCGSVPVSGDNRSAAAGVLTSNYVRRKGCQGVCELKRETNLWMGSGNWTFPDWGNRRKGVGPTEGRIEYEGD